MKEKESSLDALGHTGNDQDLNKSLILATCRNNHSLNLERICYLLYSRCLVCNWAGSYETPQGSCDDYNIGALL